MKSPDSVSSESGRRNDSSRVRSLAHLPRVEDDDSGLEEFASDEVEDPRGDFREGEVCQRLWVDVLSELELPIGDVEEVSILQHQERDRAIDLRVEHGARLLGLGGIPEFRRNTHHEPVLAWVLNCTAGNNSLYIIIHFYPFVKLAQPWAG